MQGHRPRVLRPIHHTSQSVGRLTTELGSAYLDRAAEEGAEVGMRPEGEVERQAEAREIREGEREPVFGEQVFYVVNWPDQD